MCALTITQPIIKSYTFWIQSYSCFRYGDCHNCPYEKGHI